ncbi:hypothetical protein CYY_004651 [Polysphondylium violaceum]|uniref:Transmembrane protein n=1 Tax=Polysphondylium violaceum TaxID=133409 RepID=A0A8J4PW75_9MYCE|nr:hypothetical protein CYY_004651 [Polysphondylium violaceum]
MSFVKPNNPEKYITNEQLALMPFSKGAKFLFGVSSGVILGCLSNAIIKKPLFHRPYVHLFGAVVLGALSYQTHDRVQELYNKDIFALSQYEAKVKEHQLMKQEIAEKLPKHH